VSSLSAFRRAPAARPPPWVAAALPWAALAAAGVVVVAGVWIRDTASGLGAPHPPFLMHLLPAVDPLVLVSVAVLGAAVWAAPVLVARVRSGWAFAGSIYLMSLALGLALNLARVGTDGWWKVFAIDGPHRSAEGRFEYLTGLPQLHNGIGYYLSHFGALFNGLPTHVKGNAPGPLVALHLLGIGNPGALAALCIGLGAFTAPLAYDLGRAVGGSEQRARIAGALTAFAPSMLLFGVTSADYAYAAFGLVVGCLLVRRSTRTLIGGSIALALASFFSWLLLAIPFWVALVVLRRDGWRRAVVVAVAVVVGWALFNGLLAALFGYDPFSALSATHHVYTTGFSTHRPYSFWVFGSPAAWALMLGLPLAWLALRALSDGETTAIALWALILVASVLGFTKGETERIWLPFVPLACVAAAAVIPPRRLRLLLGALAFQALAVELLFFTVW
jgi:hypothetical protein